MKSSERQAVLFFILVVICIVTAVYAGSGLLLAEAFGVGFVYGFCFITDPKLLFVLLMLNAALSQEVRNKPGGNPAPANLGWLGIVFALATCVGVLVCFVFGLFIGAAVGEWFKREQPQQ
jgi:hypothetical protein